MRLNLGAVTVGTAIAVIGGVLLGALYFTFLFSMFAARSMPADTVALDASDFASIELLALLSTATGGFVAARIAKLAPIQHGAAIGLATLAAWLLFEMASPGESSRTWSNVVGYVAEVPAGAIGGYLAMRANQPLQPPSDADAMR
jgi:hypothetical protein